MLADLGRRIERLMYFGALLLVACVIEIYVVSTVDYVRSDNPEAFGVLASKLESRQDELQSLFETSRSTSSRAGSEITPAIQQSRVLLGLPPEHPLPAASRGVSYVSTLNALIVETSRQTGMRESVLSTIGNASHPPAELIGNARAKQKQLQSRAVVVWGIESPMTLPFQYGSAQYQIPNGVLAVLLLVALVPLCIGWFGSLYFTRQRELFLLRGLTDYKAAFPHMLNVLPINPLSLPSVFDFRHVRIKSKYRSRKVGRVVCALVRTCVLLVFAGPVLSSIGYALVSLLVNGIDISLPWMASFIVIFATLLFQVTALIVQEWILLANKEFTA